MNTNNILNSEKFTIAPQFNSFVWFPPKSASSLVSWIFTYFDFRPYHINPDTKVFEFDPPILTHFGHHFFYPPNYENMDFIITLRNPYERIFSFFKLTRYSYWTQKSNQPIPTKEDFDKFFYNDILKNDVQKKRILPEFDKKFPNYVIRREFLLEDLLKIDFIKNSKLNESGILTEMCSRNINSTPYLPIENYITGEIKEKIYEVFKDEFQIGGYEK